MFGAVIAGVLVIAGAVWAFGGGDSTAAPVTATSTFVPTAFELRGTLSLNDGVTSVTSSGECAGYRGYDDIYEGSQVTVYDAAGKAVGLGRLYNAQYSAGSCVFEFTVGNVPLGDEIYQVEVSHRGKVSYKVEDAKSGRVSLSLGR
ncbi:hypothetical protein LZG04_32520 [Saccharothrix sp. S26]|uniref:hypothetical protein n=1 Tax=Saccharothrix sp. S26 TaxID=2907215 RepID=UPI001F427A5E|nr:hypothetical protein [Saccharothrix sp. S26]MCE6999502.1 hypothetical protein [Saccharothrix sp. S26]